MPERTIQSFVSQTGIPGGVFGLDWLATCGVDSQPAEVFNRSVGVPIKLDSDVSNLMIPLSEFISVLIKDGKEKICVPYNQTEIDGWFNMKPATNRSDWDRKYTWFYSLVYNNEKRNNPKREEKLAIRNEARNRAFRNLNVYCESAPLDWEKCLTFRISSRDFGAIMFACYENKFDLINEFVNEGEIDFVNAHKILFNKNGICIFENHEKPVRGKFNVGRNKKLDLYLNRPKDPGFHRFVYETYEVRLLGYCVNIEAIINYLKSQLTGGFIYYCVGDILYMMRKNIDNIIIRQENAVSFEMQAITNLYVSNTLYCMGRLITGYRLCKDDPNVPVRLPRTMSYIPTPYKMLFDERGYMTRSKKLNSRGVVDELIMACEIFHFNPLLWMNSGILNGFIEMKKLLGLPDSKTTTILFHHYIDNGFWYREGNDVVYRMLNYLRRFPNGRIKCLISDEYLERMFFDIDVFCPYDVVRVTNDVDGVKFNETWGPKMFNKYRKPIKVVDNTKFLLAILKENPDAFDIENEYVCTQAILALKHADIISDTGGKKETYHSDDE
jgi:hypothetical protein